MILCLFPFVAAIGSHAGPGENLRGMIRGCVACLAAG